MPVAYLPEEHKLLQHSIEIASEIIANCIYYQHIKNSTGSSSDKRHNPWYSTTQNAYYTEIILGWCRLFGREREQKNGYFKGEPTHYFQLLKYPTLKQDLEKMKIFDSETLKEQLLSSANIVKADFDDYREEALDYRNKWLIHRELAPKRQLHHAKTDIPFETCKNYYSLLQRLKNFSDEINLNNEKNLCAFLQKFNPTYI